MFRLIKLLLSYIKKTLSYLKKNSNNAIIFINYKAIVYYKTNQLIIKLIILK